MGGLAARNASLGQIRQNSRGLLGALTGGVTNVLGEGDVRDLAGLPSLTSGVIGAVMQVADLNGEIAWSPTASALLPDVLPVPGAMVYYNGARQLGSGGSATHAGSLTLGGALTLAGAPTLLLHAATKGYVDSAVGAVDLSSRVPYTGASQAVNLGSQNLTAGLITATGAGPTLYINRSGMSSFSLGDANGDTFRIQNAGDTSDMLRIHGGTKAATFYGAVTASGLVSSTTGLRVAGLGTALLEVSGSEAYLTAPNGALQLQGGGGFMRFDAATGLMRWYLGGSFSTGFGTNTAGEVQVNNGTMNTFANFKAAAITASGDITLSAGRMLRINGTGGGQATFGSSYWGDSVIKGMTVSANTASIDASPVTYTGGVNWATSSVTFTHVPTSFTSTTTVFQGANSNNNDVAGSAVIVAGGQGRGSGAGGSIKFQTASAGSTGSTLNALVDRMTISQHGLTTVTFNAAAISSGLLVNGSDGNTYATLGYGGIYGQNSLVGMDVSGGSIGRVNVGAGQMHLTHASGNRSRVLTYGNLELSPGALPSGTGTYVEINNGTAGTLRDLLLRDLVSSTLQTTQVRGVGGNLTLVDHSTAITWNLLRLGGTTSSYPAIKRNGTAINLRLADNSADAPLTAGAITSSGSLVWTPQQSTLDPTTTDIPSGRRVSWYNSTIGEFRDWVNIGGVLLKSASYT